MTILIIGASGAVGTPTIKHLVKRGAKIRALTSNDMTHCATTRRRRRLAMRHDPAGAAVVRGPSSPPTSISSVTTLMILGS